MFGELDARIAGWRKEFDVQAMLSRCFEDASSLQEAFDQQFRAQFEARFGATDADSDESYDEKSEKWKEIEEVLEAGLRYDRHEIEGIVPGSTVLSVWGNPDAMVDYHASTDYFEQGKRGAIYEVPDSDTGEPMWIIRRWGPPETSDAVLEEALYDQVCDLLPSPEYGWRVSTGLPWEIIERVLDRIVGTSVEDWVRWFVESVNAGDLNELDRGAKVIAPSFGGEEAALRFLEKVVATGALPDQYAHHLPELKEAFWALWED